MKLSVAFFSIRLVTSLKSFHGKKKARFVLSQILFEVGQENVLFWLSFLLPKNFGQSVDPLKKQTKKFKMHFLEGVSDLSTSTPSSSSSKIKKQFTPQHSYLTQMVPFLNMKFQTPEKKRFKSLCSKFDVKRRTSFNPFHKC